MKKLLFAVLLMMSASLWGKDTITINKWLKSDPIGLTDPIEIDTINIFGKKSNNEFLMGLHTPKGFFDKNIKEYSGEKILFISENQGKELQFYSFYVEAKTFSKFNIEVESPYMFQVYINDVKEKDKFTIEEANKAKDLKVNLAKTPAKYKVTIKLLVDKTKDGSLSAKLVVDKGDISVSTNPKRSVELVADMMEGERVYSATVSPDGKYILIRYGKTVEKDKSETYLKLVEYATNKELFTWTNQTLGWMPNSTALVYSKKLGTNRSLKRIDIPSMQESTIAENLPEGSFTWAPDESFLIYSIADTYKDDKSGVNRILTPQDRVKGWRNRNFLYKYSIATGSLEPLTFGYKSTYLSAISPDSKKIAITTSKDNYTERPFSLQSTFIMDLETKKLDTIWTNSKFASVSSFSPDGKQLLISGGPEAFNSMIKSEKIKGIPNSYHISLFIMDIATKKVTPIIPQFDPSVSRANWNTLDGNIYITATDRDRVSTHRYLTKTNKLEKIELPVEIVQSFSVARNSPNIAFVGQDGSTFSRAGKYDIKTKKSEIILYPRQEYLKNLNVSELKDWDFTAKDGTTIYGRYYLPPNFDATKKYPLLVYYYGGTTPVTRNFEATYSFHLFSAMGYVVYVVQPSGAIGFGQEFSARHVNAWGQKTADDIIEGTKKFCADHKFVDSKKIGCFGASYGGFMTMYLQTRTDIFAAAISHAGISDITSYWGEGYWGYAYNGIAAADSYPWNNKELFVGQSPLFSADKIKTPILLLHGAADTNVPVGESIQMFTALKILGKEVELITFDGQDHFILETEKKIQWLNSMFAWFSKHLQDDNSWWENMYPEKNL